MRPPRIDAPTEGSDDETVMGELVPMDVRQALFEDAYSQLYQLHTHWRLYVTFFGDRDATTVVRDAAPFTFGTFQALLIDAVVLGIDQLLEAEERKGQPASIATLIKAMPPQDAPLKRDLKKRLQELRRVCAPVAVHRDRLVAHRDAAVVLNPEQVPNLSVKHVRIALSELSDVLDIVSKKYHGGMSCAFLPDDDPDTFDADLLLALLREALEHRRSKRPTAIAPEKPV
jgi:hypothetical protein